MALPVPLSSLSMKFRFGCRISKSCRQFYQLAKQPSSYDGCEKPKVHLPCVQRVLHTSSPFVLKRSMCTPFHGFKFHTLANSSYTKRKPWDMRLIHTSASSQQANPPPAKTPSFLKKHRENLKSAPMPALVLGFSGLIPFVLPAVSCVATMSCSCNVAYAQMAYGATILSFLGGVRWGLTLSESDIAKPNWLNLGYSVTPSLIAWLGLLMPLQPSVLCVSSGLLLAGVLDTRMKGYPPWFKSLRFYLTSVALFSLIVTYVYLLLFPTDEPESGYNWYKLVKIVQIILED